MARVAAVATTDAAVGPDDGHHRAYSNRNDAHVHGQTGAVCVQVVRRRRGKETGKSRARGGSAAEELARAGLAATAWD